MKDVGGHKNLGVGVVGNLKEQSPPESKITDCDPKAENITEKKLKEGTVNEGIRTAKAEYLRHHTKTVGIMNKKGEYEVVPTKQCGEGDTVWVLEDDETFTLTKIY